VTANKAKAMFWDADSVIQVHILQQGLKINAGYHRYFLKKSETSFRENATAFWSKGFFFP
jgi:hypothetical protein